VASASTSPVLTRFVSFTELVIINLCAPPFHSEAQLNAFVVAVAPE